MLNIYNTDDDMEVFMCSNLKSNLFLQCLDHDMSNKMHDSHFLELSTPNGQ